MENIKRALAIARVKMPDEGQLSPFDKGKLELTEPFARFPKPVTPAKAGVQNVLKRLDSGFRRNDAKRFLQDPQGIFKLA